MKRCYLFGIVVMLLCAQAALAQTFSVKGVLRDPLGRTVEDGSYKLTLRLYTQADGGTEFWSEAHSSVQAQHGVVSVELGSVESLASVGFGETYWLGIQVENHAEMEPRIKLGTNPYSLAVKGKDHVFPSTGNVGINTMVPTQPLEVNGNAKVTGALIFSDGSSMSSADLGGTASSLANSSNALITTDSDDDGSGEIQFLTGTSTDMVISNAGNVGIGTATPANNLSVAGAADISGNLGIGTASAVIDLALGDSDTGLQQQGDGELAVYTNNVEQIRVGASGNVGIGTATPASKLSVAGNADITGNVGIGTATPASKLSVAGNADITGNLGIGTATPANKLSVAGNADITGNLDINGNLNVGATGIGVMGLWGIGSYLELGVGVADKQGDAGKIGFRIYSSSDALDIVGAGSAGARRIKFWAEDNATFNGRVGIGTDTPVAALHVTGNRIFSTFTGDYWNTDGCHGCPITNDPNIIAYFNGNVMTGSAFIAASNPTFSDQRTKRSHGQSDGDADLETLLGIEITDYKRIDPRATGGKQEKKVIAQQVLEVYPRAVSYIEQVIPNVYAKAADHHFANSILTVKTAEAHGFAIGDRVDVFTDKEDLVKTEVLAVDGDRTFSVAATQAPGDIFVYGKWVDDFHVVDYDALSMLNISATQELARRLQAVERENVALRTELGRYQALEAENALLKVRMERFEAALQRLDAQQAGQQRVENVAVKVGGLSLAD